MKLLKKILEELIFGKTPGYSLIVAGIVCIILAITEVVHPVYIVLGGTTILLGIMRIVDCQER